MQMHIKRLFKASLRFAALFVTVLMVYLCLKPLHNLPIKAPHIDKLFHAFAYVVFTLLWLLVRSTNVIPIRKLLWVAMACFVFGIIIEVLQETVTTYRSASTLDIIANGVGVFIAVVIFNPLVKKIHAILSAGLHKSSDFN